MNLSWSLILETNVEEMLLNAHMYSSRDDTEAQAYDLLVFKDQRDRITHERLVTI